MTTADNNNNDGSLWAYVFKNIYSSSITPEDLKYGRTGFKFWDELTQYERDKFTKICSDVLGPAEKAQSVVDMQRQIRERKRADLRLKNLDNIDGWREIVNESVTLEDVLQLKHLISSSSSFFNP